MYPNDLYRLPLSNRLFRPHSLKLSVLISLSLILLLQACKPSDDATAANSPPKAAPPPPKVKVAQPLSQSVNDWTEFTGHIEAVDKVDIRARVSGYLDKINFSAGQRVKAGAILFQIDPKPLQAQLTLAQAELEQARSKQSLAQNDFKRAQNLLQAKAISTEEYDGRSKGLQEAIAAVKANAAKVAAAQLNLDYTQIKAPISGRVGRTLLTTGNLVNSGGEATLLTTIVSTDPVHVYINADERSVLHYKRQQGNGLLGKAVELALADESDFPHHGKIDFQAPQADAQTGTLVLRGVFPNPNELLSPGFFARVRIRDNAAYPALLIPDRAIGTDQAQRFVWVVKADKQVEYRKVSLGSRQGELRVITSGITATDQVVTDGLQKIKPGIMVEPELFDLSKG